jgi:hypothetical protein
MKLKQMKSIHKVSLILLLALGISAIMPSCKKDETGTPTISYARITRPESSDSLLVAAGQGQLIAVVGDNLQDAVQVWFNDQQARLTPTYITKNSLLVSVPSNIPKQISNKLKLVFKNGYELLYDFKVQISKPVVASMVCEYVNDGSVATIRGNYFYAPVTVTLTGGVTAQIASLKDNEIQFTVPAGAQPGPITVQTNFGTTKSDFWFRDNRNIFISSDPWEGWNGANFVVSTPGPSDPVKINGNYIRVNKFLGSWSWNEIADGTASSMPIHSKRIPDDAILNPDKYNLKFEVNTLKPYNNGMIRINAGTTVQDNTNYQWKPPFDTKGQWQTVVIPYEEVFKSYSVKPTVNKDGYWSMVLMQGPGDLDADISFDNFRIVPKIDK